MLKIHEFGISNKSTLATYFTTIYTELCVGCPLYLDQKPALLNWFLWRFHCFIFPKFSKKWECQCHASKCTKRTDIPRKLIGFSNFRNLFSTNTRFTLIFKCFRSTILFRLRVILKASTYLNKGGKWMRNVQFPQLTSEHDHYLDVKLHESFLKLKAREVHLRIRNFLIQVAAFSTSELLWRWFYITQCFEISIVELNCISRHFKSLNFEWKLSCKTRLQTTRFPNEWNAVTSRLLAFLSSFLSRLL